MFDAPIATRGESVQRVRRKPKVKPVAPLVGVAVKPLKAKVVKPAHPKRDALKAWAYSGVGLTLGASAALNGLAFAESAPVAAYGWGLGVAIPVMILVFSRVSAMLWAQGQRPLARCGAVACLSMLMLSVQHCAVSIGRLTGEHVGLAALMALAIDAGLVVCELATVKAKRERIPVCA